MFTRYSLAWVVGPFIERCLGIRLTGEQRARLFEYYRVDKRGRRVVRRAAVLRPKGVGKSPEGGYLAFAELCGPVVFAGWGKDGRPKGKPHASPIIDIAAVAEDQTGNVMQWLYDVLVDRPKICQELGLDVGMTRIRRRSSRTRQGLPGEIRVVSSAADSKEGTRSTFVVVDQSESLTKENGGVALVATLRRNVGKRGGWSIELMNAPEEGDGSVADRTITAAEKGSEGIYFDRGPEPTIEVKDLADIPTLVAALRERYGEAAIVYDEEGEILSGWVDVERLAAEINDPDTDPTDARRFYLNERVPKGQRAFDRKLLVAGQASRPKIERGAFVTLGFDGALFHDSTALVVCEVGSGTMMLAGIWEKPKEAGDEWQTPLEEVDARVEEVVDEFDCALGLADPFRFGTSIAKWNTYKRKPWFLTFDTSKWKQVGHACRSTASEIRAGEVGIAEGEPELLLHLGHAMKREVAAMDEKGHRLWTLRKPAPSLKIDAAMAGVLAAEARRRAIAGGLKPRRKVRAAGF